MDQADQARERTVSELLEQVASGAVAPEEAARRLEPRRTAELGYAAVDLDRAERCGAGEVVYGAGKTAEQICGIVRALDDAGQHRVLITRLDPQKAQQVARLLGNAPQAPDDNPDESGYVGGHFSPARRDGADAQPVAGVRTNAGMRANGDRPGLSADENTARLDPDGSRAGAQQLPDAPEPLSPIAVDYRPQARLGIVGGIPEPDGDGEVVVACAGTSDLPVAEEAALTAEFLGNRVTRLTDVGVAGIHRLLAHREAIGRAQVVVAVAGMEGALASVIGGLASCPVIAVPTSVGYGASLGGVAALLAMLNSCASGVSTVNIDNGFGAGYQASLINHLGSRGARGGAPTTSR